MVAACVCFEMLLYGLHNRLKEALKGLYRNAVARLLPALGRHKSYQVSLLADRMSDLISFRETSKIRKDLIID